MKNDIIFTWRGNDNTVEVARMIVSFKLRVDSNSKSNVSIDCKVLLSELKFSL